MRAFHSLFLGLNIGVTTYEMRDRQDKIHLLLSLSGETEFSPGWMLSNDAALERGSHNRDVCGYSAMVVVPIDIIR